MTKKQLIATFNESSDVSVEKYYVSKYGELPNTYIINFLIDLKEVLEDIYQKFDINEKNIIVKVEEARKDDFAKINYDRAVYLIEIESKLLLLISSRKAEIYYSKQTDFNKVIDIANIFVRQEEPADQSKKFYVLTKEDDYTLKPYDLDEDKKIDEDFFPADFDKTNEKIKRFLCDKEEQGIILLYGKPLTGKTTYLKYLFSQLDKKFILIPKNKFSHLSSLDFYLYISAFHDSVLILEDCEQLLSTTPKNSPLSEFLNNAEGLFSNSYKYKIICTFTGNERLINYEIIRKSKNIIKYEFTELDAEQGNKLREKFGIKEKLDKTAVLGEILNPKLKSTTNKTLGFK